MPVRNMLVVACLCLAACTHEPPAGEGARPAPVVQAEPPPHADIDAAVLRARFASQSLGKALLATLTSSMSLSGPAAAITVCNEKAPEVAADTSGRTGVDIGRTALRVRNPQNAPDAFERTGLEAFAAALASGADPAKLERHELVRTDAGWSLRYMSPIVQQELCSACHGKSVEPTLMEAIRARYPQDEATGFAAGELRGAFTATLALEP